MSHVLAKTFAASDALSEAWSVLMPPRNNPYLGIDALTIEGKVKRLNESRPLALPADASYTAYVSDTVPLLRQGEGAAPAAGAAAAASGTGDTAGVQLIAPQLPSQNLSDLTRAIVGGYLSGHSSLFFTSVETASAMLEGMALCKQVKGERALRHIAAVVSMVTYICRPTHPNVRFFVY